MTVFRRISLDGERASLQRGLRGRLMVLMGMMLFMYGVMAARLFVLTVLPDTEEPRIEIGRADEEASDALHYGRADIVDRNGILLATTLPVASLYVDAALVAQPQVLAEELLGVFPDMDRADLVARLSSGKRFVWLRRGITPAQHQAVLALGDPSLRFQQETRRIYPQGALFAHTLGYVGVDGQGLEGLERLANPALRLAGEPLATTMDVRVQYAARKALAKAVERFSAIGGTAMVADIRTGEVLAAVSYPDFDPHFPSNATASQIFNRVSTGVYEMGSTFKIFSTAAYLERVGTRLSDTFDASKPLKRGRFQIRDYHAENRVMTVPEVFMHSSNIGAALMGEAVGTEDMREFYRALGFMEEYRAPGLVAARGQVPHPWRDLSTLTVSYGHGLSVSPVHLMNAFVAVVGDGTVRPLHMLEEKTPPLTAQRVVGEGTVKRIRQLLRLTVAGGTGSNAEVEGFAVGGKTGTAEKIGRHGYDHTRKLSSFIGAFPAYDPRYAVLVIVDEPQGRKDTYGYATGGWVAAPAVAEIVRAMASIYSLEPADAKADAALYAPLVPLVHDADLAPKLKKKQGPTFVEFDQ